MNSRDSYLKVSQPARALMRHSTKMSPDDLSDPSDWRNTSLPALSALDSSLRCLICKDFYTAPVITACLHTFCSLCIRRSLTAESTCPACRRTNISDNGLRQNKVVAELVENFIAVRYLPRNSVIKQQAPITGLSVIDANKRTDPSGCSGQYPC